MSRIKLNFRQLTIPGKVTKGRQVITSMTDNPAFTNPTPSLAAVTAAIDGLESAHAEAQTAKQIAKTKTSTQNEREDAADKLMAQLAAYVEAVGGDDEVLIRSAGMDTRSTAVTSTASPSLPGSLEARGGVHEGTVDTSWDSVPGARSYIIEKSPDPPTATSWGHAAVSTKARATIGGLPSGSKMWFRVAAVSTSGQSGWSDPATCTVP